MTNDRTMNCHFFRCVGVVVNVRKYQLVFEVVNSETDLFIASQLEPIVSSLDLMRWDTEEGGKGRYSHKDNSLGF